MVAGRERLSEHLLRLRLGGTGLAEFASSGVPDEWVGVLLPGQQQSRFYTVRDFDGAELTLDVELHGAGVVTRWVGADCVGDPVRVSEPRGSFALPAGAQWVLLVGDLTAMPAMARIAESEVVAGLPVRIWAETADDLAGYLPDDVAVCWLSPPEPERSGLADVVARIDWPPGEGYFWMAGEAAQMRAIRKYLMWQRKLPGSAYDVMGYWRGAASSARSGQRQSAVDPGPIWRAGKAAGKTDEQIWADYDAAREQ